MKAKTILLLWLIIPGSILAQPKWKRSSPAAKPDLGLFHSTMTANFPTTETLKKDDFEFEISHRFVPSIKEGVDANFGFDGPVRMRMALSYGLTDHLMLTIGRSNLLDNLDLGFKYKLIQNRNKVLPSVIAIQGGIALNTEIPKVLERNVFDVDNLQFYVQAIYNTMLFSKRFGIGMVPSYLYNSSIFTIEKQYTFTLGNYYQYYFNGMWSIKLEYNPIIAGYQGIIAAEERGRSYNSVSFGFDIETGGHVFQLFLTNNLRLNPSQYLVGADRSAGSGEWSLGFGFTRQL
jgi:hypothetical protein